MEGVSRDPRSSGARLPRPPSSSSSLCSSSRHTSRPRSSIPPEGGGGGGGAVGGGAHPLNRHDGGLLQAGVEDHAVAVDGEVVVTVRRWSAQLKLVSLYLPQVEHRCRHVHNNMGFKIQVIYNDIKNV